MALAGCSSLLLLGITTHVTQNIASVPLLWIIPLALILGSLTLLFTTYAIRKTLRLSRQWQERLGAANGA